MRVAYSYTDCPSHCHQIPPSACLKLSRVTSVSDLHRRVLQSSDPLRRRRCSMTNRGCMKVRALDAPMPFDFEHKATRILAKRKQLTIGIIGFGNFGQFLAERLVQAGHTVGSQDSACCSIVCCTSAFNMQILCKQHPYFVACQVLATSRTDYREVAAGMGVAFFTDINDFCEEHPEVVIFASSILSMGSVLGGLPVQRLKRNTLFVDVLSVKEFPKRLMLSTLPPEVRCVSLSG